MQTLSGLNYYHVDVFSDQPLSGNGLIVFPERGSLDGEQMQRLTQEMRQFESIFLQATATTDEYEARIFTVEEELAFAGHPVLGAAAVLHELQLREQPAADWKLALPAKPVAVRTERRSHGYRATMDQGPASVERVLTTVQQQPFLDALRLDRNCLHSTLPMAVVSTGLPYLIVPLRGGLEQAAIAHAQFEALLQSVGAKFVYVLDVEQREGRTWDNAGLVEDSATGSAAGPVGAYLVHHKLASVGERIRLRQGRFVGRPSLLQVQVEGSPQERPHVFVSGDVVMLACGYFL